MYQPCLWQRFCTYCKLSWHHLIHYATHHFSASPVVCLHCIWSIYDFCYNILHLIMNLNQQNEVLGVRPSLWHQSPLAQDHQTTKHFLKTICPARSQEKAHTRLQFGDVLLHLQGKASILAQWFKSSQLCRVYANPLSKCHLEKLKLCGWFEILMLPLATIEHWSDNG